MADLNPGTGNFFDFMKGGWLGDWWNNVSGTTANNAFSSEEAAIARAHNSAEAQKQRDFEMYMSNTAHQREVKDLIAAGINPAQTAGGSGASTPAGASASSPAATASSSGNGGILGIIGKAASVAIAKGLEAKFTNSAMRAADNHELVSARVRSLAAQEQYHSARAAWYNRHMHDNHGSSSPQQLERDANLSWDDIHRMMDDAGL